MLPNMAATSHLAAYFTIAAGMKTSYRGTGNDRVSD
jgi:hypothetical protein